MIGTASFERALCNIEARVILMPFSASKKLKMGEMKLTTISLQLTDLLVKSLISFLKDVPIKVNKFFICIDFFCVREGEIFLDPHYLR